MPCLGKYPCLCKYVGKDSNWSGACSVIVRSVWDTRLSSVKFSQLLDPGKPECCSLNTEEKEQLSVLGWWFQHEFIQWKAGRDYSYKCPTGHTLQNTHFKKLSFGVISHFLKWRRVKIRLVMQKSKDWPSTGLNLLSVLHQ